MSPFVDWSSDCPECPENDSICVDAAWSPRTKKLEFRAVCMPKKEEIFRNGPYPNGTCNVGEFLAIVGALCYLKDNGLAVPVYSDSKVAIRWTEKGVANTALKESDPCGTLSQLVSKAEDWLRDNPNRNRVLKWNTKKWGEILADYGRKR